MPAAARRLQFALDGVDDAVRHLERLARGRRRHPGRGAIDRLREPRLQPPRPGENVHGAPPHLISPAVTGRGHDLPGGAGRLAPAVAGMFDQHGKGDALRRPRPRFVRREADEPRVRRLARHFGGAGLAGDAQRVRPQRRGRYPRARRRACRAPSVAAACGASSRSRFTGRPAPQLETRLGEHAAVGQRRRHARHAQRARHHVALPVGRLRQRGAEALDRSARRHRDAERRRRVEQRLGTQLERQLREVGVAREHQAVVHADRAVRMRDPARRRGPAGPPGMRTPTRPSGRRAAAVGLARSAGSCRSAAAAVTSLKVEPGG